MVRLFKNKNKRPALITSEGDAEGVGPSITGGAYQKVSVSIPKKELKIRLNRFFDLKL